MDQDSLIAGVGLVDDLQSTRQESSRQQVLVEHVAYAEVLVSDARERSLRRRISVRGREDVLDLEDVLGITGKWMGRAMDEGGLP